MQDLVVSSACEKVWESIGQAGITRICLGSEEVLSTGGHMIADRSRYIMYDKHEKEIDHGKLVIKFCRQKYTFK